MLDYLLPAGLLAKALALGLVLLAGLSAAEAAAEGLTTVRFRGLSPNATGGREGLRNPERGLRLETRIGVSAEQDEAWGRQAEAYGTNGLTLAQTYCYLTDFVGKPISEEKLRLLQDSFDALRRRGLKAVLRFAYETDTDRRGGAPLADILRHLEQLTPLLRRNADVIFVMQAGFVGAWGEWHSSTYHLEADHAALAQIVAAVLQALPEDRMTQVRVPKYKRWVLEEALLGGYREVAAQTAHGGTPTARIGFNNDGFLAGPSDGGTWPEGPLFGRPGNPEYDQMTRESAWVAVDGELFWSDQAGPVDGLAAAVAMRRHHYSSFSAIHSSQFGQGKPYSMDVWARTPLTLQQAEEGRLPVSDGYFDAPRTQFEYIRDHLGYRLELRRGSFPAAVAAGTGLPVRVELINRGFCTLHNPRPVVLVLVSSQGQVAAELTTAADPRDWQPTAPGDEACRPLKHLVEGALPVPAGLAPGRYRLGVWLPDAATSLRLRPEYAVRVANEGVPFWVDGEGRYGINLIGEVKVGE